MNANKVGRLALMTATTGLWSASRSSTAGRPTPSAGSVTAAPASHTWLAASGQYGPALIDGTSHDDDIIGSDGDDTIDAGPGDDVVCGAAGDDSIAGGKGDDAIRGDTGDDDLDGGAGEDTVVGDGGNDTVAGGDDDDFIVGGSGDDVMISADDDSVDKVNAGDDFDVCLFGAATTCVANASTKPEPEEQGGEGPSQCRGRPLSTFERN